MQADLQTIADIAEEDRTRAEIYALLGRLLAAPPSAELLKLVASVKGDDTELGEALTALAASARGMDPQRIAEEYHAVFLGVARGELLPYASYYLTGFLQAKPLANLRGDMAKLGITRSENTSDPEDHIASLCEMMAGLITGVFDRAIDLGEQHRFFDAHVAPWAPKFFADLEASKSAAFYMPVGKLGRTFMDIETQAFVLAA